MEEIIFLDSNRNKLLGTLSIPKNAKSVVIISHGFSSNKESKLYTELETELNNLGIGTFRYDYYGHGKLYCKNSKYKVSKNITLTKCVNSLKAAIKFVREKGNYKIGLFGSSFGGLISLIVSSKDLDISALVLKSPVTEPINFWKERLNNKKIQEWKNKNILHYNENGEDFELEYNFWKDLLNYNTYNIAKNIISKTLIIHGDCDNVVPIKQSYELAKIINTKVKEIKGANHNYETKLQKNELKKVIINFLKLKL